MCQPLVYAKGCHNFIKSQKLEALSFFAVANFIKADSPPVAGPGPFPQVERTVATLDILFQCPWLPEWLFFMKEFLCQETCSHPESIITILKIYFLLRNAALDPKFNVKDFNMEFGEKRSP